MSEKIRGKSPNYPFWFGGSASCMAAFFTHPLDLVKVRLQTMSKVPGAQISMVGTFLKIVRNEGPIAVYSGLSASILRQATYSTARFGVYAKMKQHFSANDEKLPFLKLSAMAAASGWIGGAAGNPADIINVRMQQDRANPPAQRRNYRNAIDGIVRMTREEGVHSLFRGIWPNTLRAALMSTCQLATYDQFKTQLMKLPFFEDGLVTHFSASLMSGLVATTVCSPVDVIKTRIMTSHDSRGIMHLLTDITGREGVSWMFRGWVPSFIRLGPQTVLTFIALEQHQRVWRWMHDDRHEGLTY
ncbi:mitochondrial carrier [Tuber magnatum]|uniref:Mitochondrial carrier n=1 Tax=Tuber magnatum TaxID=42249 RepID=A0A317SSS8_9PEZI|nr:mitochondrial carrier [Tuber magnatum]